MKIQVIEHTTMMRGATGGRAAAIRAYLLEVHGDVDHFELRRVARTYPGPARLTVDTHGRREEALKAWRHFLASTGSAGWASAPSGVVTNLGAPPLEANPALWGFDVRVGIPAGWQGMNDIELVRAQAEQWLTIAEQMAVAGGRSFADAYLRAERLIDRYSQLRGTQFCQDEGRQHDQALVQRYLAMRPTFDRWLEGPVEAPNLDGSCPIAAP